MINGQTAQPTRVQNLFHSVQLNVNNPHFLIMQGRITKVLNMKPPEILGMLEEAAGTRMYENKKETALKTLDKKQTKVDEIDKLLEEEILPTIEKLRKERGEYMSWAAGNDSLERLRRFCVAFEFVEAKRAMDGTSGGVDELKSQIEGLDANDADRQSEFIKLESETARLEEEQHICAGGDTVRLTQEVDTLSKTLVKEQATLKHKKVEVQKEKENAQKLRDQKSQHETEALKESERLKSLEEEHAKKRLAAAEADKAFEVAVTTLRGVQSGTGAGGDGNKSLQTQLADTTAAVAEASTLLKYSEMKAKHVEKELTTARKKVKEMEKKGGKLQQDVKVAEEKYSSAQAEFAAHPGSNASEQLPMLEAASDACEAKLRKAQENVDIMNGQLSGLDFKFANPSAKFDRSKVKGVVAKLMAVKDPAMSTALEVVAGGKLYQVVVDSAETGKALLANGKLQKRVTIVPLDKVDGRGVGEAQIKAAQKVSNGDAKLALSLVTYDDDVKNVMSYVFGKAFVCKDTSTARQVAFDKNVLTNCVTVEGDLLNPGGLLTGGSRGGGASVLAKLHALQQAESDLEALMNEYAVAREALTSAQNSSKAASNLEASVDQCEHALKLAKEKLQNSESAQFVAKVTELEEALKVATEEGAESKEAKIELTEKANDLKKEIEAFANEREQRLEQAKKQVAEAKKSLAEARAEIKNAESEMNDAAVERETAAAERASIEETIAAADEAVSVLESELKEMEGMVVERQEQLTCVTDQLNKRKAEAKEVQKAFGQVVAKKAKLVKEADSDAVARKALEHKILRAEKDASESKQHLSTLLEDHPWIESEQSRFGQLNTEYDFTSKDPVKAIKELQKQEEIQQNLAKRINKKVIAMFDKAEAEFKALQEKRRIVLNDRSKIEAVIYELDEKKKEALKVTWEKVNADFGSIFSTLLPSTSAKLDPPEGESFLAGLEVKVAFGGVWKESLTELSGGQRSLLALSLILALLLFKPAPIYILDEVDAALDLSHTQNIGRMIRAHFPYSQFIVVSLKEGMFNNANCIFRTKFVDGVSTVTRTVPALKNANQNAADDLKGAAGVSDGAAAKQRRRKADTAAKEN